MHELNRDLAADIQRPTGARGWILPDEAIVIVGLGSAGTRHLHNLRALGHEHFVALRSGLGPAAPDAPGVETTRGWQESLRRRPRAAIIANPTALHTEAALAAARGGCHLLIEKPVSDSWVGLDALRCEVRRRDLVALVGFQLRFHPALERVRSWVAEGAIGSVVCAEAHWGEHLPGWHPGEDYRLGYSARRDLGGGVLLTLCHPFDYLRWIVGEIAAVQALCSSRGGLGIDVEDTALASLVFADGALGHVHVDYVERPPRHQITLLGDQGSIRWDQDEQSAVLWRTDGSVRDVAAAPPGFRRNDLFLEEMRHFLDCVAGKASPAVSLEDGIRTLEVVLAARQSACEGRLIRVL